ncbi:hypothetical protein [Desulforhopalus sp. IMCC35007]|uniref:hypothetical protein n=1 Tax=Desulforhopalus sp. IMCC35007 TaxID=2569543 RepID=UPI0010AE373E|nr:hypothetical protein [Desulforhopalus sp. IMCC35007]TKB11293.1 hypothetical protein FCL48_04595 [Desulforhopalus sp. IMCC35007]
MTLKKGGEQITDEKLQNDLTILTHTRDINLITQWHNLTLRSYKSFLDDIDKAVAEGEVDGKDQNDMRNIVNGFMERKMRNFCFIMHLSNFEEISFLVCKEKKETINKATSSIIRFKKGWSLKAGCDVEKLTDWNTLLKAEKVRNCILHACERVSLVSEKRRKGLEAIIKEENLTVSSGRIEITVDYIDKVKNAILELVNLDRGGKSGFGSSDQ